jgi:hypothetical protein
MNLWLLSSSSSSSSSSLPLSSSLSYHTTQHLCMNQGQNLVPRVPHVTTFIHSFRILTKGAKPLPQQGLHRPRYSASSFNNQYLLFSSRSSSSCLRLLPLHLTLSFHIYIKIFYYQADWCSCIALALHWEGPGFQHVPRHWLFRLTRSHKWVQDPFYKFPPQLSHY